MPSTAQVGLVGPQRGGERRVAALLGRGELAAHHDALPRRERERAARAGRLAVAALDAAVDLGLDRRSGLQILEMRLRVIGQHDSGVEHARGVAERLQRPHDRRQLGAVLPLDERRHDAARAVLGLEGAALGEHERDDLLGHRRVAGNALGGVEALGEQEVDVAVLGVAEDDGALVAVPREQLVERLAGRQQIRHRHRDVLQQRGRAARAGLGDRRVETLAHVPQRGASRGFARESERRGERQPGRERLEAGGAVGELRIRRRVHLDEERRVPIDREPGDRRRCVGEGLRDAKRGGVHELDRREARGDEGGQGGGRIRQSREHQQPGRHERRDRNRAEHRLSHPPERALAADQQPHEQVDGPLVVEERIEAVAHRVLHREQATDARHRLRVAPNPLPQGRQPGPQFGRGGAQLLVRIGGSGIDHRAVRQHERHRLESAVGVLLGSARHAGGVVRDHATDRAGDLARRVGAQPATEAGQPRVDLPHGRAGLHAHARTAVEHLDARERTTGIDQQLVGDALARQARAARAEGQRAARAGRLGEQGRNLVDRLRPRDLGGAQQVVARVMRHRHKVDRPLRARREHSIHRYIIPMLALRERASALARRRDRQRQ